MKNQKLYLAYGSNLNMEQMLYRCPDASVFGTAVLEDYQLLFKGSKTGSYLTVEPCEGSTVPLGVWRVSAADERALDRYEGFPSFYYKRELVLPVKNEKTGKVTNRRAFIYIMNEERKIGSPSTSYLKTCGAGYKDFGFKYEPLLWALELSNRELERLEREEVSA